MTEIKVVPLGAGQDVGRSCIIVTIGGKNIMLDCGMHMGFNDERRFPDFNYIDEGKPLTDFLDCVIISHFHLDHCGALPYMTEMVGYDGPIYMTHPTKAIAPILLEDFRKITSAREADGSKFFTSDHIKTCMKKSIAVNLHQRVQVDDELEIKAYYAGHVLGAAMFHIRVGSQSVVYTGDYNMTPDRHLGAAWIDKCRPDLLITESTYATTIRDSKRCRERDFLKKVLDCVENGGKVLIPVFALGRAQELCILLETFWERLNLKVPIYFSQGLAEKSTQYYKLFISWTNQKIKKTFVHRNMFEFKHIKAFEKTYMDNPGPMVVFATPGMLHAGLSLQIFKRWCTSEKNVIIMPGYCVVGTVGHKILNGVKKIEFDGHTVDVKMQVQYMSFSAHADAKGIIQLIRQAAPKNVMLVHGEEGKMEFLKSKVQTEFGIDCYMPANGETVTIRTDCKIPVDVSLGLLKRAFADSGANAVPAPKRSTAMNGVLVMDDSDLRLLSPDEILQELDLPSQTIRFTSNLLLPISLPADEVTKKIMQALKTRAKVKDVSHNTDDSISVSESVLIKVAGEEGSNKDILLSWSYQDEELGGQLLKFLQNKNNLL
ncbi:integrator complex subunit 11-like [Watersipora subatra]|uniref:integrator complex subunit 11-like n=1 Tax=Watersipora subatra TaxID=2589382 RepID=UPI00355BF507